MEFWDRHKQVIVVIIGLLVVFGIIYYFGNKSVTNGAALANASIKNSTENFSGAVIVTNYGSIGIEFMPDKAPRTVKNFIDLAEKNFYDNTKFHRVIKDFMIQGGDPLSKDDSLQSRWGTGGPGYKFNDEINDTPMVQGVVAMANAGPNTNGSQFFIITALRTPWLEGGYTAFAKVTSGMDVALQISNVKTGANDIPIDPVVVEKINLK